MRYLMYFEIPADVGNRLDFEEGGPGPLIGYVMEEPAPEASYTQAGLRGVFIVADLDEAQMTELMLIVSKSSGTYPEFTPVIPLAATPGIAAKAIEKAKKHPRSGIGSPFFRCGRDRLKFYWSCTGRVDSIDEDLLRRLSEVGCNSLFSGIESATNEKLKFIKKGFTTDQVIDAFGVLKNRQVCDDRIVYGQVA